MFEIYYIKYHSSHTTQNYILKTDKSHYFSLYGKIIINGINIILQSDA